MEQRQYNDPTGLKCPKVRLARHSARPAWTDFVDAFLRALGRYPFAAGAAASSFTKPDWGPPAEDELT
jgi:hypothetical protein